MSTALTTRPVTLFESEEYLQALLDTEDLAETDEQRVAVKSEISLALRTAVAKRDKFALAIAITEAQEALVDAEMERLKERKRSIQRTRDRMEGIVADVILSLGTDERGKLRKLEGNTSSLSLQRNPASVEIIDESSVPAEMRTANVSMPWPVWERAAEFLGLDADRAFEWGVRQKSEVSRTEVRKALDAGQHVPGARIAAPKYRVVRK